MSLMIGRHFVRRSLSTVCVTACWSPRCRQQARLRFWVTMRALNRIPVISTQGESSQEISRSVPYKTSLTGWYAELSTFLVCRKLQSKFCVHCLCTIECSRMFELEANGWLPENSGYVHEQNAQRNHSPISHQSSHLSPRSHSHLTSNILTSPLTFSPHL